ncbi:MAG: YsnF/AvaK domain-containing protein, partial [Acidobacteriia bacterium]|nr:YsnF/AvaK domain-containing protein [Terriglobia bacterium]
MADTSKTTSTVAGVFDDYSTADKAAQDLVNAGIPSSAIEVESNFRTGAAGRSGTSEERQSGGISGFFRRLFGDDEEEYSGHYAEAVRRGGAVVCVNALPDQVDQVVRIMNASGAVDIDRRVEGYREAGYQDYDPAAAPYTYDEAVRERDRNREVDQRTAIPVVEEELQVGKRTVRRGGVRVYSRIVEQPVEETIDLREEHVRVERRPVNRDVEPGDTARLRDQSVEVVEMSEEPVVQKRARIREEVVVSKETTQRTEQIRDNVRHTEVEVEPLSQSSVGTPDFRRDFESRYADSG